MHSIELSEPDKATISIESLRSFDIQEFSFSDVYNLGESLP